MVSPHAEIHALIQYSLDRKLDTAEEKNLSAHLHACPECQSYAGQMHELESSLYDLRRSYASISYSPIPMEALTGKKSNRPAQAWMTRFAVVCIVLMMAVFGAWQFTDSDLNHGNITPQNVPSIPTPSTTSTNIQLIAQECKEIRYIVREGDTVEKIAIQINVPFELIEDQIQAESLLPGTELQLSLCGAPPAVTVHPPAYTSTLAQPSPLLTIYTP